MSYGGSIFTKHGDRIVQGILEETFILEQFNSYAATSECTIRYHPDRKVRAQAQALPYAIANLFEGLIISPVQTSL